MGDKLGVLLGNGNGTFSYPYFSLSHDIERRQPGALALADFNNDGGLDIAVADQGTGDVSLLLKNTVI